MNLTQEQKDMVKEAIAVVKNTVVALETMAANGDYEGIMNAIEKLDDDVTSDTPSPELTIVGNTIEMLEKVINN